jgi:hypothetical protein
MMHFKLLEKQEVKSQTYKWIEIIKVRAEINEPEIETKRTKLKEQSMKQRLESWKR